MSDQNQNTEEQKNKRPEPIVVKETDNYRVLRGLVSVNDLPFQYHTIELKSLGAAIDQLNASIVLALVNTGLNRNLKARAMASLDGDPDTDTKEQILAARKNQFVADPVLVSMEDAIAYRPGERSPSFQSLCNKATAELKKGNKEAAQNYFKRAAAIMNAETSSEANSNE